MLKNTENLRGRSKISGDPVADAIISAQVRLSEPGMLVAGGTWSLRFPPPQKIKFNAVVMGTCWLILEDETEPRKIAAGDVFILPSEKSYVLTGKIDASPVDALPIFDAAPDNRAKVGDGKADLMIIGGHIELDRTRGWLLEEMLPPLLHIDRHSVEAEALGWLLDQLVKESIADRPGAMLASVYLVQMLFIHALRFHFETAGQLPNGVLGALHDPQLAPVLRLLHHEPGRDWRLSELARQSGMSRTAFALRFKTVTGTPPLTYLRGLRMHLAETALRGGMLAISEIGLNLGYQSESAFSTAFKRHTGLAPYRYRLIFSENIQSEI